MRWREIRRQLHWRLKTVVWRVITSGGACRPVDAHVGTRRQCEVQPTNVGKKHTTSLYRRHRALYRRQRIGASRNVSISANYSYASPSGKTKFVWGEMIRAVAALGFVFCGVTSAIADDVKLVGNWVVSEKEDRFEDGGTFFAMTFDGAGNFFAVRCIEKTLTLGIGQEDSATRRYKVGDKVYIKLRVDKQPILELTGVALLETLIQVDATAEIVRSIRDGKEIAVRQKSIQDDTTISNTTIFNTKGNAKAFARLTKECKAN